VARPREFDEGKVLDAAMYCFWAKGFEATSTRELAEQMGLAGASLYNAFGDKRSNREVRLDYAFDRLLATKLQQVYEILVSDRVRVIGNCSVLNGKKMKAAAICARVSSGKQKEEKTIASQTPARTEFACKEGYDVPREWIFEDEGFSGASLVRPGLERLRDLAAEGQLEAILVYSPDRLSRKYAYQILLTEEFARNGVETVFVKAPKSDTPKDQLLLQFQGMIAEYERAQILERSRRGKRHRARQGQVSVLSGAPYGYRYVRKSEETAAYYEVIEAEADVVRLIYRRYTMEQLSIGKITRLLNE
jgi:site-specific DNA recombinase